MVNVCKLSIIIENITTAPQLPTWLFSTSIPKVNPYLPYQLKEVKYLYTLQQFQNLHI